MEQSDIIRPTPVAKEKPSRKELQREIKKAKAIEKTKRKIKTAKKAERKLVVKAERVKANKRDNAKRKLVKKIQSREEKGIQANANSRSPKPEKKIFVKDNFGIIGKN